eukprot:scaffold101586_cov36-Phaeocystis_antarctica.AAC.1
MPFAASTVAGVLPRAVGAPCGWPLISSSSASVTAWSSFVSSSSLSSSMRRVGHSSVAADAAGMSWHCVVMRMAPDWALPRRWTLA